MRRTKHIGGRTYAGAASEEGWGLHGAKGMEHVRNHAGKIQRHLKKETFPNLAAMEILAACTRPLTRAKALGQNRAGFRGCVREARRDAHDAKRKIPFVECSTARLASHIANNGEASRVMVCCIVAIASSCSKHHWGTPANNLPLMQLHKSAT